MKELVIQRLMGAISLAMVAAAFLAGSPPADGAETPAVNQWLSAVVAPHRFESSASDSVRSTAAIPEDRRADGAGVSSGPPPSAASSPEAFHWDDATLGASAALGAVLLAVALAFGIRRRGRLVLH